jgi:ribonuclease PH
MFKRPDGRAPTDLRPCKLTRGFNPYAEGSCLIQLGATHVICTASVEDRVPPFLRNQGVGWVTAEYGMLPRSNRERTQRDTQRGPNGRTMEIQRLIGRSLRSVIDTTLLGERTITLDCDVLQADGGTRTASVTGAYVALVEACGRLRNQGAISRLPIYDTLAAISVGIVEGTPLLDLAYVEDSKAGADFNVVMTGDGRLVEVQGTAEGEPFSRAELNQMLDLAGSGITKLFALQREAIGDIIRA